MLTLKIIPTLFASLLLGLGFLSSYGQHIEPCRVDYSPLQKVISMSEEDMQVGTYVYLSRSYLRDLALEMFKQIPSGQIYYAYVRPASKQELKDQAIEGSLREVIGKDGNVYVRSVPQPTFHFFRPNAAFEGVYQPHWEDPDQVIPLGLEPVDITLYADVPLFIRQRTDDYVLLESGANALVFYIGFPNLDYLFETESRREEVIAKQSVSESFIDRTYLMRQNPLAPFRSANEATAPSELFAQNQLTEISFTAARAYDNLVCLEYGDRGIDSLLISDTTRFELYEPGCVAALRANYREEIALQAEEEDTKLAKALRSSRSWRKDSELAKTLSRRFWVDEQGVYHHLLLPVEPREAFLSARLHADGDLWLQSHYASPEGLYHTRLVIYVGNRRDSSMTSRISTTDGRHKRYYDGDWVVEEISFTDDADADYLATIAQNAHRNIRVRYKAGGIYFADHVLADIYKRQIRDCWMLSEMLKAQDLRTIR